MSGADYNSGVRVGGDREWLEEWHGTMSGADCSSGVMVGGDRDFEECEVYLNGHISTLHTCSTVLFAQALLPRRPCDLRSLI